MAQAITWSGPRLRSVRSRLCCILINLQYFSQSTCVVNEVEYGRGSARKKQAARDEAAKKALEILQDELFEPDTGLLSVT